MDNVLWAIAPDKKISRIFLPSIDKNPSERESISGFLRPTFFPRTFPTCKIKPLFSEA